MKLEIPIIADIDNMESLIEDLGHLQTYKLFEGADQILVDVDDVIKVLQSHVEARIKEEPTAEERKVGRWIDKTGIEGAWNYCSVCGEQAIDLYDFCPNCGAKMEEAEG